jgi:branched-chain amino acid transport system ATP-binding protein
MVSPLLSVANVTKSFGGLVAVDAMSFDIQPGEIMGLMGPNGAGKTTLLNVIAGEYKPDTGTIKFKGQDITGLPPHKICHLGITRTYQIPKPFTNLTALQNVMVSAIYGRNLSRKDAEKEAMQVLQIVGLTDRKDMPARDLLVVTLKRLELARALATKPTLLLLDEVAAGLTEEEIPAILALIEQVNSMGVTIILIEHVMKVMMQAVDKIVVMDKGAKIAEGKPDAIMKDSKVIEAYFG